jgi:hypothetical protein
MSELSLRFYAIGWGAVQACNAIHLHTLHFAYADELGCARIAHVALDNPLSPPPPSSKLSLAAWRAADAACRQAPRHGMCSQGLAWSGCSQVVDTVRPLNERS